MRHSLSRRSSCPHQSRRRQPAQSLGFANLDACGAPDWAWMDPHQTTYPDFTSTSLPPGPLRVTYVAQGTTTSRSISPLAPTNTRGSEIIPPQIQNVNHARSCAASAPTTRPSRDARDQLARRRDCGRRAIVLPILADATQSLLRMPVVGICMVSRSLRTSACYSLAEVWLWTVYPTIEEDVTGAEKVAEVEPLYTRWGRPVSTILSGAYKRIASKRPDWTGRSW
ncbi:hypothetical protein BD413DRAFT_265351 [Trametes elegans]|nr:hypothetical protein BD413DRAFT_265351 [Trametes elegans]